MQALTFFFLRKVSSLELVQFSHDPQWGLNGGPAREAKLPGGAWQWLWETLPGVFCHPQRNLPPPSVSLRV